MSTLYYVKNYRAKGRRHSPAGREKIWHFSWKWSFNKLPLSLTLHLGPRDVCLSVCRKLQHSSLTGGRRPVIKHITRARAHTHTRTHTHTHSSAFIVLSTSPGSSLAPPPSSTSSSSFSPQTFATVPPSWQLQAPWKMSLARITIAQDRFH